MTLARGDELVIRCRALDAALAARRPRPRWRAPMIENQQLRWFRTTLLGRTPGWSPPAAAVGPWRPVCVERRRGLVVEDVRLVARLDGRDGPGVVEASCDVRVLGGDDPGQVELVVERGGREHRARLTSGGDSNRLGSRLQGSLTVAHRRSGGRTRTASRPVTGPGSRSARLGRRPHRLGANRLPRRLRSHRRRRVRDPCRRPVDLLPRRVLDAARSRDARRGSRDPRRRGRPGRAAGMNMLRVGGTMVYESDDFYDLCDERGILVWQDFMFANMDYPDDADFRLRWRRRGRARSCRALQARPSLAVVCGNSEGEQQAAMWGAPASAGARACSTSCCRRWCASACPASPTGRRARTAAPSRTRRRSGTTSYYGVGAYLRPLEDARRAEVRFASECLAFANVPGTRALPGGPSVRVHHPAWKARTPRDLGAGWDFDDVRDHYLGGLFGVDPVELRYADHERYLALGRVVTGEVMAQVFSASGGGRRSTCRRRPGLVPARSVARRRLGRRRRGGRAEGGLLLPAARACSRSAVHLRRGRQRPLCSRRQRAGRCARRRARARALPRRRDGGRARRARGCRCARGESAEVPRLDCSTASSTCHTPIASARRRTTWSWPRCASAGRERRRGVPLPARPGGPARARRRPRRRGRARRRWRRVDRCARAASRSRSRSTSTASSPTTTISTWRPAGSGRCASRPWVAVPARPRHAAGAQRRAAVPIAVPRIGSV